MWKGWVAGWTQSARCEISADVAVTAHGAASLFIFQETGSERGRNSCESGFSVAGIKWSLTQLILAPRSWPRKCNSVVLLLLIGKTFPPPDQLAINGGHSLDLQKKYSWIYIVAFVHTAMNLIDIFSFEIDASSKFLVSRILFLQSYLVSQR